MKLTPAYLSSNFENVNQLESIKLDHKQITHIDDISFCVNLKKLDLSNNSLKSGESLSGLQYCKSLVWLNLSHNQLTDFSFLLGLRNLTVLNLGYNELSRIPEGISQLENLKALVINDNQIKSLDGVKLPKGLNTLVISRNGLEDLDNCLVGLEALEKLSASHNRLHRWPAINHCWQMKEIRLSNNKILKLPTKTHEIPSALSVIDIGHNAIEDVKDLDGIRALRHLTSLTITGNPLSGAGEEMEKTLTSAIQSLEILNSRKVNGAFKKRPNRPRAHHNKQHQSK